MTTPKAEGEHSPVTSTSLTPQQRRDVIALIRSELDKAFENLDAATTDAAIANRTAALKAQIEGGETGH